MFFYLCHKGCGFSRVWAKLTHRSPLLIELQNYRIQLAVQKSGVYFQPFRNESISKDIFIMDDLVTHFMTTMFVEQPLSLPGSAKQLSGCTTLIKVSLFQKYYTNCKRHLSDLTAHHNMLLNKRKCQGKKFELNSINCAVAGFFKVLMVNQGFL